MLKVTVKKGRKEYSYFGVRSAEQTKTGSVIVYMDDKQKQEHQIDGCFIISNAKIVHVYICNLGYEYTSVESREVAF